MIHEYKLLRYALVLYACAMTYSVVMWSMAYAETTVDGTQAALVIAAVQVPITALNGYLAKLFITDNKA